MATRRIRVKAPDFARHGELIRIKTLLMHRMETGLRTDSDGQPVPRHIINRFVCLYNDVPVFSVDLHPAMAANPFLEFYVRAQNSGALTFMWHEDGGAIYKVEHELVVD